MWNRAVRRRRPLPGQAVDVKLEGRDGTYYLYVGELGWLGSDL